VPRRRCSLRAPPPRAVAPAPPRRPLTRRRPRPHLLADPFAEEDAAEAKKAKKKDSKEYVHIRVQQRNGRKSLTTVQGLPQAFDYNKILKALKKEFCCNGCVIEDDDLGKVLQLQGDQRKNVTAFIAANELVAKDSVKVHGF
jgi:translation initiation factor 1